MPVGAEVPESVARAASCWVHKQDVGAACAQHLSDEETVETVRIDRGQYPYGYYHFQHLFVGTDVLRSAVVMRLFNVLVGVGGVVAAAALVRPQLRHNLVLSAAAAWTPMGVYFIASNNPSSWAITGTLIFAVGIMGALESDGKRRWGLVGIAAFGAILAATSRTDSAFYLLVVTIAILFLYRITKKRYAVFGAAAALVALGLYQFLSAGHSANLSGDGGWPVSQQLTVAQVFRENLLTLPDFLGTMWGIGQGPGWVDVPLRAWSTLTMLLVVGGILFVGARELYVRKGLAAVILLGAITGIPTLGMALRHVYPLVHYQGRYMLPLVAVLFLVWLMRRDGKVFFLARGQLVILVGITGVANAFALKRTAARFVLGIPTDLGVQPSGPYWWPWSISPSALTVMGAGAFVLGLAALLLYTRSDVLAAERAADLTPLAQKEPSAKPAPAETEGSGQ